VKVRSDVQLFKFHNAPVFAHWSVLLAFPLGWAIEKNLLGALVAQAAFLVLVLAHELGHAFMARRLHLPVYSLRIFAIHGTCTYGTPRHEAQEMLVAWGGICAQAVVFFLALALAKAFSLSGGIPRALSPAFDVWIPTNMLIAFCNLLPIPPLDGAKAWRFIPLSVRVLVRRLKSRVRRRPAGRVVSLELSRIGKLPAKE
jgi:Zn-dependent protease